MNDKTNTLRGIATISFYADNLAEAKKWYTQLLGTEPYYVVPDAENPAYIEFRIGDYQHELGIIDKKHAKANNGSGGAITYWHVDDVKKINDKLLAMGAKQYEPLTERGQNFVTASVIDPFGNILGIMHNPHYLEVLAR